MCEPVLCAAEARVVEPALAPNRRFAYLAHVERLVSGVLLQYEELVPYPAAFVPVRRPPGVGIGARGPLRLPGAGIQPPAASLPQGTQERQESQGSAYAGATPPHHLGPPPKRKKKKKKQRGQKRIEK